MGIDLYDEEYFLRSRDFQKNKIRIEWFIKFVESCKPENVLDVGCGIGTLVKHLNLKEIKAIGLDFAPILKDKYWKDSHFIEADAKKIPFPDNSFDLVFSMDFFEHIEEKDVDIVLNEMKRVGKRVIAFVAEDRGGVPKESQAKFHVTYKTFPWWKEKLKGIDVFSSATYCYDTA